MTFSTWFRIPQEAYDAYITASLIPSATGTYNIMQFAAPTLLTATEHHFRMRYQQSPSAPSSFSWRLQYYATPEVGQYGARQTTGDLPPATVESDKWYHLLMSVLIEGDQFAQRCYFYLNGECINEPSSAYALTPPQGVWDNWDSPGGTGVSWDLPAGPGQDLITFVDAVNGKDFYLPSITSTSVPRNSEVAMGPTYLWLGTYVDPTVSGNLEKFFTPDSATGLAVPTPSSVAIDAFGDPTLLFLGSAATFIDNQGTGAEPTETGEIQNFSPSPSFEFD